MAQYVDRIQPPGACISAPQIHSELIELKDVSQNDALRGNPYNQKIKLLEAIGATVARRRTWATVAVVTLSSLTYPSGLYRLASLISLTR